MRRLTITRAESYLVTPAPFFFSIVPDTSQGTLTRSEGRVFERVGHMDFAWNTCATRPQCSVSEMHG
jgi:hypothetical protein